ncbi:hypothetical protein VHEMI10680 [[Torrubiella] hemipterigena]|uniref:Cytochrome P450 n=1 Tax=[Torrubiella] hemipterigena TaxID=1531966 RepID=A0A0A1TSN6_9HYPO|nr:hypothetical protein VHEMI10680 [[Torrubiella] hemipterigena]
MSVEIILLVAASALVVGHLVYRNALPKPLPGIPHKKVSAERLMGDIPDMLADVSRRKNINLWWRDHSASFNSPICQVFLGGPFSKPTVLLADYHEARDIETRRTHEFDRSSRTRDVFGPLAPSFQFVLPSGSEWKAHRALVQDVVSRQFLEAVVAPTLYQSVTRLISLWDKKIALSGGRPFTAIDDMFNVTFDAVLSFTFGSEFPHSAMEPQVKLMDEYRAIDRDNCIATEQPIDFPVARLHEELEAMQTLVGFAEGAINAGSQNLYWFFQTRSAKFSAAKKSKDTCIRAAVRRASQKRLEHLKSEVASDRSWIHSSVDYLIDRECKLAEKEGRKVDVFSSRIADELYGMVVAGHDSTSSTMCWAVKYLADNQAVQQRLRDDMRYGYRKALLEGRAPTVTEILSTNMPYTDAFMEEVLRHSTIVPFGARQATQDTIILGRKIPKGTVVLYLKNGPGILSDGYTFDTSIESETSRLDRSRIPGSADIPLEIFSPDRWIKRDAGGNITYNPNAAPVHAFGFGPRSCFGRKLAYLEFRLLLTIIVWNFELGQCATELSGYDGRYKTFLMPWKCYVRPKRVTS